MYLAALGIVGSQSGFGAPASLAACLLRGWRQELCRTESQRFTHNTREHHKVTGARPGSQSMMQALVFHPNHKMTAQRLEEGSSNEHEWWTPSKGGAH